MSELDRLRDYESQMEEAFGLNLSLPNEFRLTPLEMKIVGLLTRQSIVSKEMIFAGLYGARNECDQPDIKTIDVHICKLRRKLSAKDISIKTYHGMGYYVEDDTRTLLKSLCVPVSAFKAAGRFAGIEENAG